MSRERWAAIADTGWTVSDRGRVRDADGELVEPKVDDRQTRHLWICGRERQLHRLVALAFVPNPKGKAIVDFIDHDRSNCSADNLLWCSQSERAKRSKVKGITCYGWLRGGR